MTEAEGKQGASLKTKIKIVVGAILGIVALIIILQNTEPVTTKLLFAEVSMPLAFMLIVMLAIGFGAGVLVTGSIYRKRDKR